MDSMIKIFLDRADNELLAAKSLLKLSQDNKTKQEFEIPSNSTFYSYVIAHAYYAIFYSAKAILLTKNIKTNSPNIHKKTLIEFKKNLVDNGYLDVKLLKIYRKMIIRADELLEIFNYEKSKRGRFTYKTIPQANKEPAEESIRHSILFVSNIREVVSN